MLETWNLEVQSQRQGRVFEELRYGRGMDDVREASSVRVLTGSGLQLLAARGSDFEERYFIYVEALDWQDMLNDLNNVPEAKELKDALIEFSKQTVRDSPAETVGGTAEFGDAVRSIYKLFTERIQQTRGGADVHDRQHQAELGSSRTD